METEKKIISIQGMEGSASQELEKSPGMSKRLSSSVARKSSRVGNTSWSRSGV